MIHIPKEILKKFKFERVEEVKKEAEELEEMRAKENTINFNKSMEVVNKVGKEIGEMRKWAPYCSDAKTYFPFPTDILTCTKEQMLQLLIHAYGTAQYLKDELDKDN